MEGNIVTSDIFSDDDATIVNFWSNGCGSCVEEMPYLEELYQEFKDKNINLIGVGTDSGQGEEELATAQEILSAKGVTYCNISPDPDNELYKDFYLRDRWISDYLCGGRRRKYHRSAYYRRSRRSGRYAE